MPLSVSPLSALHPAHEYEPETSSEPHPTPSQRNPSHPPHSYQNEGTHRICERESVRKSEVLSRHVKAYGLFWTFMISFLCNC